MFSSSQVQPSLTTIYSYQRPFERLATLRRRASTKATPLRYKQTAPSSKKSPTVPPTGFAAIGSYNTIARRYKPNDHGPSFTNSFQVDCYHSWYSFRGGYELYTLPTRYESDGSNSYMSCANKATVVLGREQKPLATPPDGPLAAKHG